MGVLQQGQHSHLCLFCPPDSEWGQGFLGSAFPETVPKDTVGVPCPLWCLHILVSSPAAFPDKLHLPGDLSCLAKVPTVTGCEVSGFGLVAVMGEMLEGVGTALP